MSDENIDNTEESTESNQPEQPSESQAEVQDNASGESLADAVNDAPATQADDLTPSDESNDTPAEDAQPETEKPETEKPETEKPETEKPETEKPETEKLDTEKSEPEKSEPEKSEPEKSDKPDSPEIKPSRKISTAPKPVNAIGIRFPNSGKTYCFNAGNLELRRFDRVVVESDLGINIGQVAKTKCEIKGPPSDLRPVLRKVTAGDLQQEQENEQVKRDAREYGMERIKARNLPMKLLSTEVTLDRKRFIFYFVADTRIDFRELVKDLASKFRTRIELRQIGVRDAAKMIGGFGVCGQELCCKTWLKSFAPISIKMAKQQDLVLNTCKLSGLCGRLMCCLNYEYDPDAPKRKKKEEAEARAARKKAAEEAMQKAIDDKVGKVAPMPEAKDDKKRPAPSRRPQRDTRRDGKRDDKSTQKDAGQSSDKRTEPSKGTAGDTDKKKKRRRRGGRRRKPQTATGTQSTGTGQDQSTGGTPASGQKPAGDNKPAGERPAGDKPKRPRRRRRPRRKPNSGSGNKPSTGGDKPNKESKSE